MQRFAVALGRLCALGRPGDTSQCIQCRALASLAPAAGPLANTVLDDRQNTHRAASTSGVASSGTGLASQTATAPPWLSSSSTVSERRDLLWPRLWERSLATLAGPQEDGQDLGIASKLVYHQSQRQTRRQEQEKLQAAVTLQARTAPSLLSLWLHREVESVAVLCGKALLLRARWWSSCQTARSARGARQQTRWGWSRGTCRCSSRGQLGLTRLSAPRSHHAGRSFCSARRPWPRWSGRTERSSSPASVRLTMPCAALLAVCVSCSRAQLTHPLTMYTVPCMQPCACMHIRISCHGEADREPGRQEAAG